MQVNINKQKKEAFKILRPELDEDPLDNPFFDPRVGIDKKKLVKMKRSAFQFVEEGKWSKHAEMLRLKVRKQPPSSSCLTVELLGSSFFVSCHLSAVNKSAVVG